MASATPASADPATPTNYRSQVIFAEGRGVAEVEIIHPDGDWVLVESPHGTMRMKAEIFPGMRPDTVGEAVETA